MHLKSRCGLLSWVTGIKRNIPTVAYRLSFPIPIRQAAPPSTPKNPTLRTGKEIYCYMKNDAIVPSKVKLKPSEIITKISSAQKRADLAKKKAQAAKAIFKRARKVHKLAKKAAKAVRSEIKKLEEVLKAMKVANARAKSAGRRKKPTAKKTLRAKPAKREPVVAPAPTATEVVVPAAASPGHP